MLVKQAAEKMRRDAERQARKLFERQQQDVLWPVSSFFATSAEAPAFAASSSAEMYPSQVIQVSNKLTIGKSAMAEFERRIEEEIERRLKAKGEEAKAKALEMKPSVIRKLNLE